MSLLEKIGFRAIFTCIIFVLFQNAPLKAQMQVYPVSVTTRLIPPYSVNLSDYAAPGCEQLKVIILQRDLTQAPYLLFLRMEIELNGKVIIRTSSGYNPPPLTIEPGIPTVISGTDLAVFFDPANMEFTGYSRESYLRTKTLPEGAYVISFTAYDFSRRDVALSQGGSMFCYLSKTDPPLLNLPLNNAVVRCTNPQNINFHWLSRSTSSPNSAFSTAYRLELFEMRTGGRNPSEIVQNSRPVFTCETDQTTYNYSIADPILEKGMRYVWRVKAFDRLGSDYIRNDGYSEVFSFLYDDAETSDALMNFNAIGNFIAEAVSPRMAKLTWDASTEYRTYKVYYREKNKGSKWYEAETDVNNAEVKGLVSGLTYECRVQGKRGNAWGSFSETDTVLMPVPALIECGATFEPLNVTNRQPLSMLMKMQQFDAGGFMVTLTDAYATSFSPGRFSGKGFVEVPLFGHKKVECEFTDVFINTDFQMVEGSVALIKNVNNSLLADLDKIFEGGSDNGKVREGTEQIGIKLPDIAIGNPEQIILNSAGNEILVVQSGDTVHVDITEQLKEAGKTVTLKDKEGNIYSVNTQTGKVSEVGKSLPANKKMADLPLIIDSKTGKVEFKAAEGARFAFDTRDDDYNQSNLFKEEYETIKMSDGTNYDVPIKLIPVGETDIVQAEIDIKGSLKPDSVMFVSGAGTIYKAIPEKKSGNKYIITLPSGKENDGLEIFAVVNDEMHNRVLLGKLIVVSYSVKHPKVILVPVNGNISACDTAVIKKELDKIYNPVAVDWKVNMDHSGFTADDLNLDVTGSGLFSQYTDGMKALNASFIEHKEDRFDESAIYLFMLKKADNDNVTGDMPRSRQFGYIFTETAALGGDKALIRTIAHEIAHGAFHLNHTFDNQYRIPEKKTDNLMDYTDGTILVKHQWDAIHDPGLVVGMFERDEEGMHALPCWGLFDDCDDVLRKIEAIKNAYAEGKTISGKIPEKLINKIIEGKHLKVGQEDFDLITVNWYGQANNEYTINPKDYKDYHYVVTPNETDSTKRIEVAGFEFRDNDKLVLRVLIESLSTNIQKKIDALKIYLFSISNHFEITCNDKPLKENSFILINSKPQMPDIKITNTSSVDILLKLRIEYRRDVRNDDMVFPDKEWMTLKANEVWHVDFGENIIGGKATLKYKIKDKEYSYIFYIRGTNPSEEEIKEYIRKKGFDDIWFLTRLIRQESTFHQFNEGTNYGSDWESKPGCPNFGLPHGWGMMQLDVIGGTKQAPLRPTSQELWDWKANLNRGVMFIKGEKFNSVKNHFSKNIDDVEAWNDRNSDNPVGGHAKQTEGNITYSHSNSDYFNFDFGGNPALNNHSFMDATWIKNYNGSSGGLDGYPGYYYVLKQEANNKPYWSIQRTNSNNHNYVEAISNRNP